tara:strand:+ start:453 stop:1391 length:939 start_codon:yes stop_codon:yes gene_type:complete
MSVRLCTLKVQAKRLKIRVTKTVNGKRIPLSVAELSAAIEKVKQREIKKEIKEIVAISKSAAANANDVFHNASNNLENEFFNADNTPFELRDDFENAIRNKNGKKLIDKAMSDLKVKGVEQSTLDAMRRDAAKMANYIGDLVKSGKLAKALFTVSALFSVYKLYENPTLIDRTVLNEVRKIPFLKPVMSDPRSGKIGWLFSVAGFDPTKKEQGLYEIGMSGAFDNRVPGRSIAGLGASYLTMVVLSLTSVLPYEKTRGPSIYILKLVFKLIASYAPTVGKIVIDNFVSKKTTAHGRAQAALSLLPKLIGFSI